MWGIFGHKNTYVKYIFEKKQSAKQISFVRQVYWHQHGLTAYLFTHGYQSNLSLHMCSKGFDLIGGPVKIQSGVLGLRPLGKVCINLAKIAILNLYLIL